GRLTPVIELTSYCMLKLLQNSQQLIALAEFCVPIHEPGQLLERGEVFFDFPRNIGPLDLHCDGPPIVQSRAVNLPERSRSERFRIEIRKCFRDFRTELTFHDEFHILDWNSLHLILKPRQR